MGLFGELTTDRYHAIEYRNVGVFRMVKMRVTTSQVLSDKVSAEVLVSSWYLLLTCKSESLWTLSQGAKACCVACWAARSIGSDTAEIEPLI